ncbi:unnamed protein product [Durusdinium trenchii]|uniref:Cyclic nucleotide-binding domain-containing protein n=1 Tax=Durusdinium trenchii TaxID=1381693 RepID=A0ABP0M9H8_9DINO
MASHSASGASGVEFQEDFWMLHRRLGEQHELELKELQAKVDSLPAPPPLPNSNGPQLPEGDLHLLEPEETNRKDRESTLVSQQSVPSLSLDHKVRHRWLSEDEAPQVARTQTRRPSLKLPDWSAKAQSIWLSDERTEASWVFVNVFRRIQHPGSLLRIWWGSLGMMLLGYDVIFLPLRFFPTFVETSTMLAFFWTARLYWTLDLFLGFITGFYDAGSLELELRRTIRNYLTGWFTFDVAVVCVDWTSEFLDNNGIDDLPRLSRTMRLGKIVRLLRLSRMLKLGTLSESMMDQLSMQGSLHAGILRIVIWLLLMSHVVACFWFGIAELEGGPSWVSVNQMEDKSLLFQYATCLHWAVAQLGVGQTELEAVGLFEKLFSIGAARSCRGEEKVLYDLLAGKYLTDEKRRGAQVQDAAPDHDLSHRITRFLQHRYAVQKNVQAVDATPDILELLSKSLKGELQVQRYKESRMNRSKRWTSSALDAECLKEWDLTKELHDCGFPGIFEVRSVALHGLKPPEMHAVGDVIFAAGSLATTFFFLAKGGFAYSQFSERNPLCCTWVAEMCLWTKWTYAGDLVSKETSRVISVDVDAVSDYLGQVNETRSITSAYARRCVDEINRVGAVSDLWEDYEAEEDEAGPGRAWAGNLNFSVLLF